MRAWLPSPAASLPGWAGAGDTPRLVGAGCPAAAMCWVCSPGLRPTAAPLLVGCAAVPPAGHRPCVAPGRATLGGPLTPASQLRRRLWVGRQQQAGVAGAAASWPGSAASELVQQAVVGSSTPSRQEPQCRFCSGWPSSFMHGQLAGQSGCCRDFMWLPIYIALHIL